MAQIAHASKRSRHNIHKHRLLIACPDITFGTTLVNFLKAFPIEAEQCHDRAGLLRSVSRRQADIVLLDLSLNTDETLNLVSFIRHQAPSARIVLLFEMDQLQQALDGIRHGAYFYLPKSCPLSDIALIIGKALENLSTEIHLDSYEQTVFEEFIGRTDALRRIIELIKKVAPTNSTVLLLGESGTGKEVVAQTIHRLSTRREMPFIAVNCAALPDTLLESELFGHVKGAFTGAHQDKQGLFEAADGGTLFLDEIGELPAITQAKLLRALQGGEIRRVGAIESRKMDVRIIAATNRDLLEAVEDFRFREDLYYRLNVIQIRIPPLRERLDALPALVTHFIAKCNQSYNKSVRGVDQAAAAYLQQYPYPGNVRELESIIAHAVIVTESDFIGAADLPEYVRQGISHRPALPYHKEDAILSLTEMEANHIRFVLDATNWNQTHAANKLGISRSTLWRKMREYNLQAPPDSV
ncbi:MAG TPA: sigma-54 dependent transcriptional regulator [Candidatus Hydrogenedentes bacterium]|jgi:two-component system response regulator HydG|nr:MAG: Transcriptional regulatory protein ZraR [Candidatus Hydrogenedentes bacterium ADurb.Bin170]HNZ47317.1 sigma-54 dependent transcriptional regulator [Candidatus Hydrogenedentota bacterium]HOD95258.1 sigma-54 dependent transcriptional regulator [Candidatus Hydrogenedentota bacterium]HOH41513.1 sigma-54 dependent transcriptional regulator [Candidatus Hydrogenedentota bacterium]HOM48162.1 sigma-54 dependent transcriptional regulator [Candidatus Hydrogenedentota bacterium]